MDIKSVLGGFDCVDIEQMAIEENPIIVFMQCKHFTASSCTQHDAINSIKPKK